MIRFLFLLVFLCGAVFPVSYVEASGAAQIFEEVGKDMPQNWNRMTRDEKHAYFQSLGLYPARGSHYKGTVGSLDEYFTIQGVTEPENWNTMTFAEKQEYLQGNSNTVIPPKEEAHFSTDSEKPITSDRVLQTPQPENEMHMPKKYGEGWGAFILYVFLGFLVVFTTYNVVFVWKKK